MNNKYYSFLFAIGFLLLTAVPALAEQKLAVVNIQQIMRESKAAASVRDQMKAKQKTFQEELDKREKQLQSEDQDLAKQRSVLAQDAFEKKYKEFREKAADAQKEVRTKRNALDKGFTQALTDIQKKVTDIVTAVAKEKNINAVVSSSPMLYFSPDMDITAEVLTRLNSQMPNLTVKFE